MRPGDVLHAERPLPRRHRVCPTSPWSPRWSTRRAFPPAVLRRVAGGTTPISAGSPPDRCPRVQHRGERGRGGDRQLAAGQGRSAQRGGDKAALAGAPYPARNPEQNLADLIAQIAANERGCSSTRRMVAHFGLDVVHAYMGHVQDNAEEAVRRVIGALRDGECRYETDGGAVISVAVRVDPATRTAEIDFTGTSAQLPGNFNASVAWWPRGCFACCARWWPTRSRAELGCLKPVKVIIPPGSCWLRLPGRVTAAGNVRDLAGDHRGAVRGAAGAGRRLGDHEQCHARQRPAPVLPRPWPAAPAPEMWFAGTDVVQTHMTNSRRSADPEVLEWRYPVRVESYAIRRGSGGSTRRACMRWWRPHAGTRACLEPMTVTTLASHRRVPPSTGWYAEGQVRSALSTGCGGPTAARSRCAAATASRSAPGTCSSSRPPAAVATAHRARQVTGAPAGDPDWGHDNRHSRGRGRGRDRRTAGGTAGPGPRLRLRHHPLRRDPPGQRGHVRVDRRRGRVLRLLGVASRRCAATSPTWTTGARRGGGPGGRGLRRVSPRSSSSASTGTWPRSGSSPRRNYEPREAHRYRWRRSSGSPRD